MTVEFGQWLELDAHPASSVLEFREQPGLPKGYVGRRELAIQGEAAFELSFWCGSCQLLFERLAEPRTVATFDDFGGSLAQGLRSIDAAIVESIAALLPGGRYLPMLIDISPRVVEPGSDDDYFTHEQPQTWGDASWGDLHDPKTTYYRSFEAPVSSDAHLYEFIVPLVGPELLDPARVDAYACALASGTRPTALAVTTLDVAAPAVDMGPDWYWHWGLTHFLLDGHHKLAAASATGSGMNILTLMALDHGISSPEQFERALEVRSGLPSPRP